MKKLIFIATIFFATALTAFWWLTLPVTLDPSLAGKFENGDPVAGQRVFDASGCSSCHAAKDAEANDKLKLGGRHPLQTPFGTFYAPNISPDPENGIGSWTGLEFASAMIRGVSPDGSHYYPAFPYTSYSRMSFKDASDLWAYIKTLEPVAVSNLPHELPLPFRFRRGLGLWKLLYWTDEPIAVIAEDDELLQRGQYLVEALGHCGECHTPRNLIGGQDKSRWLGGGPAPEGDGHIPNITPHETGIGSWSSNDIVYSLETGFTPSFDSFGGSMVDVQRNLAKLPKSDLEAIAAYLKAVPPVEGKARKN